VGECPELLAQAAKQLIGALGVRGIVEQDHALRRLRDVAHAANERHDRCREIGVGAELRQVELAGHESQQILGAPGGAGVDERDLAAFLAKVAGQLAKRGALVSATTR
jgi:hypothetical protein